MSAVQGAVELIVEEAEEDINRPWGTVERTFKAFCGTKPGSACLLAAHVTHKASLKPRQVVS